MLAFIIKCETWILPLRLRLVKNMTHSRFLLTINIRDALKKYLQKLKNNNKTKENLEVIIYL